MEDTRRSRLSRVKDAKNARNVLPEDCRTFNLDDSKTLDVECFKAEDLRPELRGCLLDLLEDNMRTQYEESGSEGWSREEKELEMFSRDSRQIILRDGEELIAFSHFRFDMDYDVDVVYCYEIQINNNYHRKGIGRFLVSVLEALVRTFNLTKLVLTVFDSNASALKFYSSLGFKRDITSPTDGEAGAKYQILSKLNAELCKNHHEY